MSGVTGAAGSGDGARGAASVMCVANQKGGVGKTTTAVSLAAALAERGVRVLLVDLDPQANASTGLGVRVGEGSPSTYRVLIGDLPVAQAVRGTDLENLEVLPASLDLAGAEIELVSLLSRESQLREALAEARSDYGLVLIDCPPSLGLLTINGLVAADQVLVPIQCEYYALEGLGHLLETIRLVHDGLNSDLQVGGVVLTMHDARTNLAEQVADEVRAHFGDLVFQTVVPRTVRLSEAPSFGQPIELFDPSSRGARAYQRLAGEVAGRLGLATAGGGERHPLDALLGVIPPRDPGELQDPEPISSRLGDASSEAPQSSAKHLGSAEQDGTGADTAQNDDQRDK